MKTVDDTFQEVMNRLGQSPVRCLDVETSGLNWQKNHIVGYVLAFGPAPRDSYYLPFRHAGGGNLNDAAGPQTATGWDGRVGMAERQLLRRLDQQDSLIFGHNISFDLKFLARTLPAANRSIFTFAPRIEDTIINAPLLDEYQPFYNLEYCCAKAKVAAKKLEEIEEHICQQFPDVNPKSKGIMGQYWRLSGADPVAVEYATSDGVSTWQLRDWQMPQIVAQDLTLVHDIESRLIPILVRMSVRGIKIDLERLEWLEQEVKSTISRLLEDFPADFNPKSNDQVRQWMQNHGCTDWPTTPTGKPSMVESWLENHEPGRQVVAIRKYRTLQSTFIEPMRDKHLSDYGYVHTTYNQLRGDQFGTITGRLSCNNPNLQAVPKHDEQMGRLFRSIFVPDDGMVWGSADYSQCEPVLLAFYSRCKALLDGFRADPPVDAHTAASMVMNGPRWNTMTDKERKKYRDNYGKRINQTIITGGGQNVLVTKYKVPANEVQEAWNAYHRGMPEIKILQREASKVMRDRGYVKSLLGRRARLNPYDPNRDYVAVNRLLQVGNADVLKLKLVECDDYLRSQGIQCLNILNNVHDSVDFQLNDTPEGWAAYERCKSIMTDFSLDAVIKLDVPLRIDAGEGKNWSEATYGEEK